MQLHLAVREGSGEQPGSRAFEDAKQDVYYFLKSLHKREDGDPMATRAKKMDRIAQIIPYLLYKDVASALAWLRKAFGFKEFGDRFEGPDGKVQHAAMQHTDRSIFMMGCPGPKYKNPKKLGSVTQIQYVTVENVDQHFLKAKKAGAKILEKPSDTFYGARRYGAVDPEGHQWFFAQKVRDVPRAELKKHMKAQA
jgi:PhnB protein